MLHEKDAPTWLLVIAAADDPPAVGVVQELNPEDRKK
jgi:hypothetical protein